MRITTIYPPANRPGQLRNESYERSLQVAQDTLNTLLSQQFTMPVFETDPAITTLVQGQMWYNSTDNKIHMLVNGVIKKSAVFT